MLKNPQNLDLLFHFRFINDFRRDPLPKKGPKPTNFSVLVGFRKTLGPKPSPKSENETKYRKSADFSALGLFQSARTPNTGSAAIDLLVV